TAVVAAFGMSTAHADTDNGGGSGHTDALGRVAVAGTQPDWAKPSAEKGAVPAAQVINSRIYLAGQSQDQLAALAKAVTDPASPDYHKYLTPAQVQSQFGATADQIKTVTDWAGGAGLKVVSVGSDWVDVSGTASVVQAAFGTTLANYTAPDGQAHYAPSSAAMIPAKVAGVISGISGLYDTPKLNQPASMTSPATASRPASTTWNTSGCSTYWNEKSAAGIPLPICGYNGSQLRSAYGVSSTGLTGKGTTVAIVDAYGSSTMASDASKYNSQFGQQQFRSGQYREV